MSIYNDTTTEIKRVIADVASGTYAHDPEAAYAQSHYLRTLTKLMTAARNCGA